MELVNQSRYPMEVTTALDKGGREHLVLIAKATYRFSDGDSAPELVDAPRPIALTDSFVGEPGLSAPLYEADLARVKKRCDVLVDATAHAPGGRPVSELDVSLRVGPLVKQFVVIGNRTWRRGRSGISQTAPEPFTSMPIHYGRAFGGSPLHNSGAAQHDTYLSNPVGRGYCRDPGAAVVDQMPLPNTEDPVHRARSPDAMLRPLAFGPIGRHWHPRSAYAGTYDARWREDVFPLLPGDFDESFFQAAPADQQIDFIQGGEDVTLRNLVPGKPLVTFKLPRPELPVKLLYTSHRAVELPAAVDTLFIEPEVELFSLVYRASLPLDRRGLFGISLIAAGPVCKRWWQSRVLGTEDCGCGGDGTKDESTSEEAGALVEPEEMKP